MNIGDIVKPKPESKFILASGASRYDKAVVVSINPLVLVSEETDMRWEFTIKPEDFEVCGQAGKDLLKRCMRRLNNIMYKITVKGEAKTKYKDLKSLDGIDCQDNFADYFRREATYDDDIESGYMDFRFENGKLFTYTDYISNRELTPIELEDLKDYTCGQWSDGIGEGFEQCPCRYDGNKEIYISPWFSEQISTITQIKIES